MGVLTGAALLGGGYLACSSDNGTVATVDYAYEDPYLYDYYYPVDTSYSGYYSSYAWDYGTYYPATPGGAYGGGPTGTPTGSGGTTGAGGSTGTDAGTVANSPTRPSVGNAIRAIIRGESVCPGQVTVTPRTASAPCTGSGSATVPAGINIVFNGCQLSGGGKIDGTFDVTAQTSASTPACGSGTTISLSFTTTVTNLVYTGPAGPRIVIPSQTDTGSASFTFGQNGSTATINTTGEVQYFNAAGTMIADHSNSGSRTLTFNLSDKTYTTDGTFKIQDKINNGTASLVGTGVLRSSGCCRPTGGTLVVSRTGGLHPGSHTWGFGSACGAATLDGTAITLPACE
jgi:hypothetical protein